MPSFPELIDIDPEEMGTLSERKIAAGETACNEASCPNVPERFGNGTATFMIMGGVCTRRCPFCEVGHGRPLPLDPEEPEHLAAAVKASDVRHVVITSMVRDDLTDGGAAHFVACIKAVRGVRPEIRVEILTPDFRGKVELALDALYATPPDVFNHNLETVPRLYGKARPGADYEDSLELIRRFGGRCPNVPTKSGLMLGRGEEMEEIRAVMRDLRAHGCRMLTLGQYLAPSDAHLPVQRYVSPEDFDGLRVYGEYIGFEHVVSGSYARSPYGDDARATGVL